MFSMRLVIFMLNSQNTKGYHNRARKSLYRVSLRRAFYRLRNKKICQAKMTEISVSFKYNFATYPKLSFSKLKKKRIGDISSKRILLYTAHNFLYKHVFAILKQCTKQYRFCPFFSHLNLRSINISNIAML